MSRRTPPAGTDTRGAEGTSHRLALSRPHSVRLDPELERQLQASYFKGHTFSVEEGIVQICLHSHGHRAQVAIRLRELGGTPPSLDFVIWLKDDRPPVVWPEPTDQA